MAESKHTDKTAVRYVGAISFLLFIIFSSRLFANVTSFFPTGSKNESLAYAPTTDIRKQLINEKIRLRNKSIERESLDKAIRERISLLIQHSEFCLRARDYTAARAYIRQILSLDPHNKRALNLTKRIDRSEKASKSPSANEFLKEDAPHMTNGERKETVSFFMKRGERLLKKKLYDEAVEELEKAFVIDPLNKEASQKIDAIKNRFIREKKKEWKGKAAQYNEEFSERLEYSLNTVRRLIKEERFMEAKVMLNRMAFVDPENKTIRKLMKKVQEKEKSARSKSKAA